MLSVEPPALLAISSLPRADLQRSPVTRVKVTRGLCCGQSPRSRDVTQSFYSTSPRPCQGRGGGGGGLRLRGQQCAYGWQREWELKGIVAFASPINPFSLPERKQRGATRLIYINSTPLMMRYHLFSQQENHQKDLMLSCSSDSPTLQPAATPWLG